MSVLIYNCKQIRQRRIQSYKINELYMRKLIMQANWGTETKWPLNPPFWIWSRWNFDYWLQMGKQIFLPILTRIGRKNNFHIFFATIKTAAHMILIFFSNIFQFDGVSKVEKITLWIFRHLFIIDWILCVQIFCSVDTKLLKIQHFKSWNVFFGTPYIWKKETKSIYICTTIVLKRVL